MKKIFVILAVAVVVIASYFYVSGNPEKNKARKAAQKNFQISCDNIADALNLFKLGEIEKDFLSLGGVLLFNMRRLFRAAV